MASPKKKTTAAKPAVARATSGTARGRGEARASGPIKVRATRLGYYDDQRRRVGDVFLIRKWKEFSETWMETVDGRTPERTTTSQQALHRATHRIAQENSGSHVPEDNGGGENPLGD